MLYRRILGGLKSVAAKLGCSLIEVEQLWEGPKFRRVGPILDNVEQSLRVSPEGLGSTG